MGRLTTASYQIEECEIRATLLNDTFEDESHPTPSTHSSQLVLHCPACNAETFLGDQFCQECGSTQPAFQAKPGISADAVKQFIASRKKVLIAVCALLLGLWPATALVSAITLADQLDRTISENRLNDAAGLAEKLFVSRFGALSGRDAESYSEAFYRRAQVFAQNRNFKLALGDLRKVLPSYSKIAEVAQLKASYQLFLSQVRPGNGVNATTSVEPNATAQKDSRSVSHQTKSANISLPVTTKTPANTQPQALGTVSPNSVAADSDESSETQAGDSSNSDKDEVNSEEVDMAAYNRHLAEYFSHAESKNSKSANKPKGSSAKEPPSFSEWVQSGKAEF